MAEQQRDSSPETASGGPIPPSNERSPEQIERAQSNAQQAYDRVRGVELIYKTTIDQRDTQINRQRNKALVTGRELKAAKEELKDAKASLRSLQNSRTVRIGRTFGRALRSPKYLVRLPLDGARALRAPKKTTAVKPRSALVATKGATNHRGLDIVQSLGDSRVRNKEELQRAASIAAKSGARLAENYDPQRRVKVAAIVDDFTRQCLGMDCDLLNLHPESWEVEIEGFDPDILFVESAWRGHEGTWHNAVARAPEELIAIVEWCRTRGVPTIFWNKEDPVHFETFINVAEQFDHVYTTDIDCIHRYRAILGHDRAYVLPFAAQPRIHNPIETFTRKDSLVFAGGYYVRYEERMQDLENILMGASEVLPVEIFDRNYGTTLEDYAFPSSYDKYIVGTLRPDELDVAYKGYRYALNLNSVKSSQSMFARRVYELLASNTLTISNFAKGLAVIFGDLVPMSDSAAGTSTTLRRLEADEDLRDRLRALSMRKVMGEHTYSERLSYMISKATGSAYAPAEAHITVVLNARTIVDLPSFVETIARQKEVVLRVVLLSGDREAIAEAIRLGWEAVQTEGLSQSTTLAELLDDGDSPVAVLHPDDFYAEHYLCDLATAWKFKEFDAVGKSMFFERSSDGLRMREAGAAYSESVILQLRSSMLSRTVISQVSLSDIINGDTELPVGLRTLSIHRFDYCRAGKDIGHPDIQRVSSHIDINMGSSITEVYETSNAIELSDGIEDTPLLNLEGLSRFPLLHNFANVNARFGAGARLHVNSRLSEKKHRILWLTELTPIADFWPTDSPYVSYDTTGLLSLRITVRFFNSDDDVIQTMTFKPHVSTAVSIPEGTVNVRLGLRIGGSGSGVLNRVMLGRWELDTAVRFGNSDVILVSDNYPEYADLYRNAFVHSRVRRYAESGESMDVFRLKSSSALSYAEFEGVEVATGNKRVLEQTLAAGSYNTIIIHFLSRPIWDVVRQFIGTRRIIVWLHGAEIQAWHRRAFNYDTEEEIAKARAQGDVRHEFWHEVFSEAGDMIDFVFVSQYFADEVMTDLGIKLLPENYSVIPNPVDSDIFRYVPKSPEQRLKILSLRPYASRVYANDLSVKAVLELRSRPWFDELEFTFVGDGPLFEETLLPLVELKNVTIQRGYLTHAEISSLYREHGVMLIPTRSDTHGVSRDEAMVSGMVPVTSAVAAVPEFVSEVEGYLAPFDDHLQLAAAIEDLYLHPDVFMRKSAASVERVHGQADAHRVIPEEINLIRRTEG